MRGARCACAVRRRRRECDLKEKMHSLGRAHFSPRGQSSCQQSSRTGRPREASDFRWPVSFFSSRLLPHSRLSTAAGRGAPGGLRQLLLVFSVIPPLLPRGMREAFGSVVCEITCCSRRWAIQFAAVGVGPSTAINPFWRAHKISPIPFPAPLFPVQPISLISPFPLLPPVPRPAFPSLLPPKPLPSPFPPPLSHSPAPALPAFPPLDVGPFSGPGAAPKKGTRGRKKGQGGSPDQRDCRNDFCNDFRHDFRHDFCHDFCHDFRHDFCHDFSPRFSPRFLPRFSPKTVAKNGRPGGGPRFSPRF